MRLAATLAATVAISCLLACGGTTPDPSQDADQALKDARLESVKVKWDGDARIAHLRGTVNSGLPPGGRGLTLPANLRSYEFLPKIPDEPPFLDPFWHRNVLLPCLAPLRRVPSIGGTRVACGRCV